MAEFKLYLFGRPRLEYNGLPVTVERHKALALLAFLALRQQALSRELLASLLWPESSQSTARTNLRTALAMLKQVLGTNLFDTNRETIALRSDPHLGVDVMEFRAMLAHEAGALPSNQPHVTLQLDRLATAVVLYTEDFLSGFSLPDCPEFDDWQRQQSEQLRRDLATALEQLVDGHVANAAYQPALHYAHRWLELDPYHEPACRALMRLYFWTGDTAAAIRIYQRCHQLLVDDLGVPPAEETIVLDAQIRSGCLPLSPMSKAGTTHKAESLHSLTTLSTPFVGRDHELAQIAQMLAEPTCRLLTVVGPGGIGKTRLATQAGAAQQQFFLDGIYFVNLAPLRMSDLLAATIVETLNLSGSTQVSPEEVLLNYLGSRDLLLILDNFEHLRLGTKLLPRILAQCPHVKLLITSRERLNLQEEWIIPLQGLEFPPGVISAGHAESPPIQSDEGLDKYSAVQLFVQCARRIQPDFSLTEERSSAVGQICRLVEGYPLAIEMASTWLRMMSCVAIAVEIQSGLNFLTTSREDVPDRHRSMRATLEHSWRLLKPGEQIALCRLSVFHGGFTPEAARTVADASMTMLLSLVDKSWLHPGADGRLQIHEFVRQFSDEKVLISGLDAEHLRHRHAGYFASFLHNREDQIHGSSQQVAMHEIMAEIDNLRAGWNWAVACVDVDVMDQFIECLYWISLVRGWYRETLANFSHAVVILEKRLAAVESTDRHGALIEGRYVLARLLTRAAGLHERLGTATGGLELCDQSLGYLEMSQVDKRWIRERGYANAMRSYSLYQLGHMVDAIAVSRRALTDFQTVSDPYGKSFVLWVEALAMDSHSNYSAAMTMLNQAECQLEAIGEQYLRAMILNCLANVLRSVGEIVRARRAAEVSVALRRALDDQRGIAACQSELGFNALGTGDHPTAERLFQECRKTANQLKDHHLWTVSLQGLGWVACLRSEWEVARQYFEESLAVTQQAGRVMWTAFDHYSLGVVAIEQRNPGLARSHFRKALDLSCEMKDALAMTDSLAGMAELLSQTGKVPQAVQLCTFLVGHRSSLRPVRREHALLAQLEKSLSPEVYQLAITYGQAMSLEEAIRFAQEHADSPYPSAYASSESFLKRFFDFRHGRGYQIEG